MFAKGDKIVYPMYGAGVIDEIEKKCYDGVTEEYYVITIPNGNLKIMLSTSKAENNGLREVSNNDEVLEFLRQASDMPIMASDNWNQRYKENMEKIKSGQFLAVCEVVKNLILRERAKGLSGAEKKMLNSAKQIVISEIVLSQNIEKEKAEELLAKLLLNC